MEKIKTIDNFSICNNLFVPDTDNNITSDYPLKGNIYYNFKDKNYETSKPQMTLDEKIDRLCVLFTSKKYAAGIEYTFKSSNAPVLLIKTTNRKWITKICKDKDITIVPNNKIAEYIFNNTEEHSIIPEPIWQDVAREFSNIKDKAFFNKTNIRRVE